MDADLVCQEIVSRAMALRVAVVTDNALLNGAVRLLDLLTPMMDVRAFGAGDAEAGLKWCESG